jgi:tRNA(Ile)-lysidine synthase
MIKMIKNKLHSLGINKKTPVIIAVSGGADSMALCLMAKQAGLDFYAVIVDHGYRKNSAKEAREVKKYLGDRLQLTGDRVTILTNKKPIPKTSVEEFLREVRYELLFNFCKKKKIKKILTAHHLDDQIETFLMRLERGSGIDGLTGMKERTSYIVHRTSFEIIRPLLAYTKEELKEFLKKNKIKWWEDESNKNTKLTRNNIRASLEGFSDYPLIRKRLSGVIENISRAKDFIEDEKNKTYKKIIIEGKKVTLDNSKYKNLHEEIRLRILRDLIKKYSKTNKDVRMDSIKNLDSRLLSKGFKKTELHGIKIENTGLNLVVFR